jgi:hypothetical protein
MSLQTLEDDYGISVVALIVAAIGVGVWVLYQWYMNDIAGSSTDPTTGQSNGILNNLDASLFPDSNPGGGEVAGSGETFTGALSTVLSDPIGSLQSILGFNPAN